jgi:hypothetical protein
MTLDEGIGADDQEGEECQSHDQHIERIEEVIDAISHIAPHYFPLFSSRLGSKIGSVTVMFRISWPMLTL